MPGSPDPFGPPPALDPELEAGDAGLAEALARLRAEGHEGLTCEFLASGAHGNVYRIENRERRSVAVKTVRQRTAATMQLLLREGTYLRRAAPASPNAFLLQEEPAPYLVMEHIDGKTVPDLWHRIRLHASEVRAAIAAAASDGMRHIAAAGILHLDYSLGNLVVEQNGGVRILDLGFAEDLPATEQDIPGGSRGTAVYMAPEQLAGRMHPRTDVYALGTVLLECLSGQRLASRLVPDLSASHTMAAAQLIARYAVPDAQENIDRLLEEEPLLQRAWSAILLRMIRLDPAARCTPAEAAAAWAATARVSPSALFRPLPHRPDPIDVAALPPPPLTSGNDEPSSASTMP